MKLQSASGAPQDVTVFFRNGDHGEWENVRMFMSDHAVALSNENGDALIPMDAVQFITHSPTNTD